jgi:choline dehydrogenase-like flavoprotein
MIQGIRTKRPLVGKQRATDLIAIHITRSTQGGSSRLHPTAEEYLRIMTNRRDSLCKSGFTPTSMATGHPARTARADAHNEALSHTVDFTEQARVNQQKLTTELKPHYDFIVCGSGSSGSVVARRLAENSGVNVLLLEAGGNDDAPSVMDPAQWPLNLGSERDWGFLGQPNPDLNGRSISLSMGKVLGGGSSINGLVWSRGHRNDWEFFASETGDPAWSYESILNIYHRIEDWHGAPDPKYRGCGGPMYLQPTPNPNPIAPVLVEGASSVGIPVFDNPNGYMMEGSGGASRFDVIIHDGRRQSVFRSYVFPYIDRPNLTVLTHALVTRLILEGKRATGVEIVYDGKVHRVGAAHEVVLSLGAVNTPKVLMQSGIGDQSKLHGLGVPIVQHLPGVGQNFQDHFLIFGCIWEYHQPLVIPNTSRAVLFWKSNPHLDTPDMQIIQSDGGKIKTEMRRLNLPPDSWWSVAPGIVRPHSRGQIHLMGPNPFDPIHIEANTLSHPDDMKAAIASIDICREIGNSAALRPFVKRELMPGNLKGRALENFIREGAVTYWHQTCTAKMGRDSMSVVDGNLKVYGIDKLRIADGSIMPRVTTGNTMAPCVVIGERAAEILKREHRI